jgi:hypothetical protein
MSCSILQRAVRVDTRQTGRITHVEYDIIDMARITGLRDIVGLAAYVGKSTDAATRRLNSMRAAGIVDGPPSLFRITEDGWDAFWEADRLMVDEAARAEYYAARLALKRERNRLRYKAAKRSAQPMGVAA